MKSIPNVVWVYWEQGLDRAPRIVQDCVASWGLLNPELQVRVLDSNAVDELLPDLGESSAYSASVQLRSDQIRLGLLAKYGGIWVDATLYCTKPLRDWLDFERWPGLCLAPVPDSSDKYFDTFFLASRPGNHFIARWKNLLDRYLAQPVAPMTHQRMKRLLKLVPISRTRIGRILFTTKVFRRFGAPYFLIHYLGTRLLATSPRCLLHWWACQKTRSGKFSRLLPSLRDGDTTAVTKTLAETPFVKLTHKAQEDQIPSLTALMARLQAASKH